MAVQQLGAAGMQVEKGDVMDVLARHDTYAVSFEVQQASMPAPEPSATPFPEAPDHPLVGPAPDKLAKSSAFSPLPNGADPAWLAQYAALKALNGQFGKTATQDPLAFRKLTRAGVY